MDKGFQATLRAVLHADAMAREVEDLTIEEVAEAFSAVKFLSEICEIRLGALREVLLCAAEEMGEATEKGGQRLEVNTTSVLREKRTASAPDEKLLSALLTEKQIPTEAAYERVSVLRPSPSRLSLLVERGAISEEEKEALHKVTWALVVHPDKKTRSSLEEAAPPHLRPEKKTRGR